MDNELHIHIDLLNLEDAKFEGSKYVLTSPRSLEACSRLDVKPIELLYKPLSEFQEELLPQDIPLKTIYSLFDESEQIRQKKLSLCREERGRILQSEQKECSQTALRERLSQMPSEAYRRKKGTSPKQKTGQLSSTRALGYRTGIKSAPFYRAAEKESSKLHRELVSKKDKNPSKPKSVLKTRSLSSKKLKSQRCSTAVTFGSKVNVRTNSIPNMTIRLPARDEKILNLMKERREEERRSKEMTTEVRRLWEDQKTREEALKAIAENKRRRLLAEENRIKDLKKTQEKERRCAIQEEELELKKKAIEESQSRYESTFMKHQQMQELQMSEKIQKESALRNIQLQNFKTKEVEDEHARQLSLARRHFQHSSASERKDMRVHEETLKKFYDNQLERKLYEKRQHAVKEMQKENDKIIRSSLKQRMSKADTNLCHVLEQRNRELEEQRRSDELKLQRARSAHRKMEAEMEAWRYGLLQHKKLLEDKASEVVSKSNELKSWRAKKTRTQKQVEQKKNISKIHKEVEKWRHDLERSLVQKDRKVEDLMEVKERQIAQTRAMAQLSQTLRDDLKERYLSDTFDKKVVEAQLYSNLDNHHRPRTPSMKNRSSIKIC